MANPLVSCEEFCRERGGVPLQRLFSTFASGWPGVGLFLQRLVTAAALISCAAVDLKQSSLHALVLAQSLAAGAGVLLLLGLWTPVIGAAIAVLEVWVAFLQAGDPLAPILLATIAGTLAIVGPGAWSFDARLFGRKHITIHDR
jgi:putative oxidoreductase